MNYKCFFKNFEKLMKSLDFFFNNSLVKQFAFANLYFAFAFFKKRLHVLVQGCKEGCRTPATRYRL